MIRKNLIGLIISIILTLSITPLVSATSKVTFEGGAEDFVFHPSSGSWDNTDLFDGFKNVLPGDQITEEIIVKNNSAEYTNVKIYLRADPHDDSDSTSSSISSHETSASMEDFLSQLNLKVFNNGQEIFNASPDEAASLTDYILLGDFKHGESTTLTLQLTVPDSLGSEYAHRAGQVDWVFLAEGFNTPDDSGSTTPTNPDTGFLSGAPSFLTPTLLMSISAAIIIAIIYRRHTSSKKS